MREHAHLYASGETHPESHPVEDPSPVEAEAATGSAEPETTEDPSSKEEIGSSPGDAASGDKDPPAEEKPGQP